MCSMIPIQWEDVHIHIITQKVTEVFGERMGFKKSCVAFYFS